MFTDFMGSFYLTLGGNSGGSGGGQAAGGQAPDGQAAGDSAGGQGGQEPNGQGGSEGGQAPGESADGQGGSADGQNGGADQQAWQGEGGAQVAKETANAYLSSKQYSEFSGKRLRSEMEIYIPVPYEKWSFDDPNYGPTREELESYGIDLNKWYEAHK